MNDSIKMTVNINKEAAAALRFLAERQGTTITNVVNRAIALEKLMFDESEKGSEIQISEKSGKVKTVMFR